MQATLHKNRIEVVQYPQEVAEIERFHCTVDLLLSEVLNLKYILRV